MWAHRAGRRVRLDGPRGGRTARCTRSEVGQAFSRRTFLQGSAAVAGISLVGLPELLAAPPGAVAAPTSTALPSGYAAPTTPTGVALPMLSDALNFSRPECYETIQAGRRPNNRMHQKADLDGDGQDELIARGAGGIVAYRFDPGTGQWWSLRNGPAWSDDRGWARNNHFATIQTADLDGDGRAELIGWGPAGIEVYRYVSDEEGWSDLGVANPITQKNFEAPFYSGTMQCADIDGDGRDELLARFSDGLHVWKLDGTAWTKMPTLTVMSDTNGWDLMSRFPTIQCADLDLTGVAWVLGRDAEGLHAWKYANGGWTEPHAVLT
ncbi:MAG TPA: VCBS repeat-containing protein, partial [Agromyces sp.]